ncbi:hypothetical protein EDD21DRAFT_186804 [Dissophora ornata]|nr:hypothetical protein EDD21DRAFT_186804 [Dissophora ornata]
MPIAPTSVQSVSSSSSQAPSTHASSLDEMALELLVAKEAQSEVEQLRNQVARLKKEIEFKDAIIAKFQASAMMQSQSISIHQTGGDDDEDVKIQLSASSRTTKPALVDTTVHVGASSVLPISKQGLQCSICVDYFSSPFTVECGHTFCYTCLHSWLEIHKSCPTCRTKLLRRPTLSFNIREQVHASIAALPEPEQGIAMEKVQADEKSLKKIQSSGDPWKGLFKSLGLEGLGGVIVDSDDGVRRCASCGWEVRNGSCVNCSTLFSDLEDSDESQDNTDLDSEPDAYDSHDSFINDDDTEEEYGNEVDPDENDLALSDKSSDSDGENNLQRRYQTARSGGLIRRQRTLADIFDDIESDSASCQEHGVGDTGREVSSASETAGESESAHSIEGDSEDESESSQEDSQEEEAKRLNGKRRQARRAIMISDEEDSDSSNESDDESKPGILTSTAKGKLTKRVAPGSSAEEASQSDESSDDNFVSSGKSRSKKQRSARMEALFE